MDLDRIMIMTAPWGFYRVAPSTDCRADGLVSSSHYQSFRILAVIVVQPDDS
jgi:hypothetical protein